MIMNTNMQYYRGLPLRLVEKDDYDSRKSKFYSINGTDQIIWLPNSYLEADGTIKTNIDMMWLFAKDSERRKAMTRAGFKFTY